jgi:putative acetyltransferase
MRIRIERPDQPDAIALIDALDAYLAPLYPAESQHGLNLEALLKPEVCFAVARDDAGAACGCGAVVLMDDYAELKRMYVPPTRRGQGVGRALLRFLETHAQASGRRVTRLETGIHQPEALRLYEAAGYRQREPFGAYRPDPLSLFMEKQW